MFTESEFDTMTFALIVLAAMEPAKFEDACDLHTKLLFGKEKFVEKKKLNAV